MNLAIISLIVLVMVVAIGFIKKVNLGFLSLGVAFILGTIGDMSAKEIAENALNIAADICIFTNHNIIVEEI